MNVIDYDVAMEVASHEALVRQTYKDSVGKLTWCVGMTNATGHRVDRYIGKPQPVQHCMNVYAWALGNYAIAVNRVFAGFALTKAQFAAALSFHWNTGAIERAGWVKLWKAGEVDEARKAFMEWDNPPEIKGRREKERDLFFDGKWSNDGTMTEYTKLTKAMTPIWSSARRLNVSLELRAAFAAQRSPAIDIAPVPDAPVTVPTLSPAAPPPTARRSPAGGIISVLIMAVLGAAFFFLAR